ncbi:MAG: exosome complex protein Rrp42 [Candidatus Marsarchaeota archaeon]
MIRTRKPVFQGSLGQDYLEFLMAKLKSNERVDGRALDAYREISVEVGIIPKADGSARVTIGKTQAVAGVKVTTGTPYADTPDEGVLTVGLDLAPFAHPDFQPGPPDERAIGWGRVVDRGIREGKAIDLGSLVIEEGKKVAMIWLDLTLINHEGNAQDAASLAALAALASTRFPQEVAEATGKQSLELTHYPVSVTLGKIGDFIIVDPSLEEEDYVDCELSITSLEDGRISSMQKVLPGPLTEEEILKSVSLSKAKGDELRDFVLGAVKRHKSEES